MSGDDHTIYRTWLDLEPEGVLRADELQRLEAHLAVCTACREERRRSAALHAMLAAARVPVRPGFRGAVMAALPAPAWAARRPPLRSWAWAFALLAVLAAGAAALLAGRAPAAAGGPLVGVLAALGELAAAALVAGAGLLGASWSGVGLIAADLFVRTPGTLVAFALLAVFLALLVVSLLRRPRRAAARRRR